jgi:hypothetical protein
MIISDKMNTVISCHFKSILPSTKPLSPLKHIILKLHYPCTSASTWSNAHGTNMQFYQKLYEFLFHWFVIHIQNTAARLSQNPRMTIKHNRLIYQTNTVLTEDNKTGIIMKLNQWYHPAKEENTSGNLMSHLVTSTNMARAVHTK